MSEVLFEGSRDVSDYLTWSACELAAAVAKKEVDPLEVMECHIARIQEVNPVINAVVSQRFDEAFEQAKAAREVLCSTAQVGPLFGLPCTVKSFLAVKGSPWHASTRSRQGEVATQDATVVRRVRRAGAIVVGTTNVPEGGLWFETNNPVYGRTCNPVDLYRTCGGSSGGEAAIVAAGGVPFGIGSDTGGSIRIPAGFCGVVGHKPTGGLVPNTGHHPKAPPLNFDPMACGPIARRVEDLELVLEVLAGADGVDKRAVRTLGARREVNPKKLRVLRIVGAPGDAQMQIAMERAVFALTDLGAEYEEVHLPNVSLALGAWALALAEQGPSYQELLQISSLKAEIGRSLLGRGRHSSSLLLVLTLERLLGAAPGSNKLKLVGEQLRTALEEHLDENTVLLHPVYPTTAPRHRGMLLKPPHWVGCTTLFNLTESPVTVVPCFTDTSGLPAGVQVVGARGLDRLTLAVARLLQQQVRLPYRPVQPEWGRRRVQLTPRRPRT